MITRADIEKLPTSLRNEITEYLKTNMDKAGRLKAENADSFVFTTDERHRSSALIAQGEYNAFSVLYNVFK